MHKAATRTMDGTAAQWTANRVFAAILVCAMIGNGVWLSIVVASALAAAAR